MDMGYETILLVVHTHTMLISATEYGVYYGAWKCVSQKPV